MHLRDGATDLGRFFLMGASSNQQAVGWSQVITPTAASHTYQISALNLASQTSTVSAGVGGAGVNMPGHLRITRVPT